MDEIRRWMTALKLNVTHPPKRRGPHGEARMCETCEAWFGKYFCGHPVMIVPDCLKCKPKERANVLHSK